MPSTLILALEVCHENRQENAHLKASIDFQTADLATIRRQTQGRLYLANIQTDVLIPESEHLIEPKMQALALS